MMILMMILDNNDDGNRNDDVRENGYLHFHDQDDQR